MARGRPVSNGLCLRPRHRGGNVVHSPRDSLSQRVCLNNAFSITFRCQNVSSLPKGFGVQEIKIQQSNLLFEQSRCAMQAKRADSPARLVPCGAGKGSRFHLPWSNLSPDHGVAWHGLHPLGLGRLFTMQMVNSVDTLSGSCSIWPWATYLTSFSLNFFTFR